MDSRMDGCGICVLHHLTVEFINKLVSVVLRHHETRKFFGIQMGFSHFLGKVRLFCVSNNAILGIKHAEGIGRLKPASGHTIRAVCMSVGSKD